MSSLRWTEADLQAYRKRQADGTSGWGVGSVQQGHAPAPEEEAPRRNKYGNCRVEIDGKRFDSKKEARYYLETLLPLLEAGEIKLILRQVRFDLPGGIRYVADFCVLDKAGAFRVIDVKSEITRQNRVYINKRKQMEACWGIVVEEV